MSVLCILRAVLAHFGTTRDVEGLRGINPQDSDSEVGGVCGTSVCAAGAVWSGRGLRRRQPGSGRFWVERRQLGFAFEASITMAESVGAVDGDQGVAFGTAFAEAGAGSRERSATGVAPGVGALTVREKGRQGGGAVETMLLDF